MKYVVLVTISTMILGCSVPESSNGTDQCLRQELFSKCLAELPKGPDSTNYNDWAEVVSSCQNAAYYHSIRKLEFVKPECRSS